uniref:ParE-like toxin of type II toxin-antitoxin system n=1 Tax=Candidatus Kentrum sp. UNK TaxID=2126344 RepID=A0A451AWX5_9GAMM|nr:MAG: ParE-like toxin of type II toxin-antitoxin system [Candidatus Kentron sp. UNK]VFK70550.1 MAG: ParE-like toxin of type II toxin-antitoxin system [Candidatus Kentron sp. UNK]
MKVSATGRFNRIAKKLPPNIKMALDLAIRTIMAKPETGRMKTGDLAGIRVHKFKVKSQLYLFSYIVDVDDEQITLLYFGTHENFYRDHKKP